MTSRTVVLTGATSGLGREVARLLARDPGWHLVLPVRDSARGSELASQLGTRATAVPADLASLGSVHAAATRIADQWSSIDALVLNAGVQVPRADVASADGYELTFAVNHLAHFLMLTQLRPQLTRDARVLTLGSGTHWGRFSKAGPFPAPQWDDPEVLAQVRGGSGQRAYATSKLATVHLTHEAARRWPDVTVNCVDPGLMPTTGLARAYPGSVRALYAGLTPLLRRLPGASTPQRSAELLVQALTGPALSGRTGRYLELGNDVPSSPDSYDPAREKRLWEASEDLVQRALQETSVGGPA